METELSARDNMAIAVAIYINLERVITSCISSTSYITTCPAISDIHRRLYIENACNVFDFFLT